MTGYHYTTYSNWLKIKKEGLIPYDVSHKDLKKLKLKGIWVFKEKCDRQTQIGSIIYQLSTKLEFNIVKLKVYYEEKDCTDFEFLHSGKLGALSYSADKNCDLITKKVSVKDIKLVKKFDLVKLLG